MPKSTSGGAAKGSSLPSFVKKGKEAIKTGGENQWLKLPAGAGVNIVPLTGLDEMISFEQHSIWLDGGNSPIFPCSQTPDCPGCMIGDKPRARGLLNVMTKNAETEQWEVKVWAFGMSVMKSLAETEEATDNETIKGHIIRVKKTGSGLSTKYSIVLTTGTAKSMPADSELIDLVPLVGDGDRDKIIASLEEAGKWTSKKKGKSAPAEDEEFDEDETDSDFEDEDDEAEDSSDEDEASWQ